MFDLIDYERYYFSWVFSPSSNVKSFLGLTVEAKSGFESGLILVVSI
jgi:hypothetical protein